MTRVFSFLAIVGILLCSHAAFAADIPGLVADEPASGPFVKTDAGYMVPYAATIPGSDVEIEMIPIPGGKFKMGSPEDEDDREDDEGPQVEVEVEPFWMGKTEVTWAQYKEYMKLVDIFIDFKGYKMRAVPEDDATDVISAPSNLYDPSMTFALGEEDDQPAVTMTPYAARQYTKFLSKLTGDFYRIPTEAEWEYAARAGSEDPYHFGDDIDDLEDYAWYAENSDEVTQPVGELEPNEFGLHDMLGNVSELVLDMYEDDHYENFEGKTVKAADAINWPDSVTPRVHRGGSWDSFEEDLRCAARAETEGDDWKIDDPNEPKSPWWYADEPSLCVGFRIMRPLNVPDAKIQEKFWGASVEETLDAAAARIGEGRGSFGVVDKELPTAIKELKKKKDN